MQKKTTPGTFSFKASVELPFSSAVSKNKRHSIPQKGNSQQALNHPQVKGTTAKKKRVSCRVLRKNKRKSTGCKCKNASGLEEG